MRANSVLELVVVLELEYGAGVVMVPVVVDAELVVVWLPPRELWHSGAGLAISTNATDAESEMGSAVLRNGRQLGAPLPVAVVFQTMPWHPLPTVRSQLVVQASGLTAWNGSL